MNLGSRLKTQLEARGLTVAQFAKDAGVPVQTVYALINRNSNKADMDILMKVLRALDMDFFTFMGETAPAAPSEAFPDASGAPEGKTALFVNSEIYGQALALAKEEGVDDAAVLAQVFEEYFALGFGYRQRPLRSLFRDHAPKNGRLGEMDSFLL